MQSQNDTLPANPLTPPDWDGTQNLTHPCLTSSDYSRNAPSKSFETSISTLDVPPSFLNWDWVSTQNSLTTLDPSLDIPTPPLTNSSGTPDVSPSSVTVYDTRDSPTSLKVAIESSANTSISLFASWDSPPEFSTSGPPDSDGAHNLAPSSPLPSDYAQDFSGSLFTAMDRAADSSISLFASWTSREFCHPLSADSDGTKNLSSSSPTALDRVRDSPTSLFAAIDPILASTTPPPAALGRTLNNPKSLLGDEDHASNLLPSPLWEMDEQPVAKTVTTCKPVDTISDTGYAGPLQPIVKQLTSLVAEKLALFAVDRVCDGTVRFGTMGYASLDSETADYMLMQVEREIDEGISRFWELYKFLKPEETFIENMPDEVKDLLVEWKNVQDNLPPLTVMDVMASHRDVLRDKGQRH